jgi:Holliday junction resolvase RusA-like endonuclease
MDPDLNNFVDLVSSESGDGDDESMVVGDVHLLAMRHFVVVMGKPKAWPRPTFMSWMKRGKMFRRVVNHASPKIKAFRRDVKAKLMDEYGYMEEDFPLFPNNGVVLKIAFYRRIPNTAFQRRNRLRDFLTGTFTPDSSWPDTMKPDLDNLVKFVMDSLQGIVYHDDDQVVKITTFKLMDTDSPYEGKTQLAFHAVNRFIDLPFNPMGTVSSVRYHDE